MLLRDPAARHDAHGLLHLESSFRVRPSDGFLLEDLHHSPFHAHTVAMLSDLDGLIYVGW